MMMTQNKEYEYNHSDYNNPSKVITINKKALHEYYIIDRLEAGLVLAGWEVKAIRAGQINISGSYVLIKRNEAYLLEMVISPLNSSSSHIIYNPMRQRKLLLNQHELYFLLGKINREGYTAVALLLYWKNAWCKVQIGVAKGKKKHDKRSQIKKYEWNIHKDRIMKKIIHSK